jgi:hypothetical protein
VRRLGDEEESTADVRIEASDENDGKLRGKGAKIFSKRDSQSSRPGPRKSRSAQKIIKKAKIGHSLKMHNGPSEAE